MNKLNLFLISAICLLLGYSCKGKTEDALTNMIPKESTFVGYLNTLQMAQKADYDPFANPSVMQGINFAKVMIRNQDAIKAIDEFTKNVNSIGVNIKGDIYIFADDAISGIILTVNDAAVLRNNLVNIAGMDEKSIHEKDGISSYTANKNVMSLCWDNSKLLVLFSGPGVGYNQSYKGDLDERALELFTQSSANSINSNPAFPTFMKNLSDISFYSSLEFLNNLKGAFKEADLPVNLPLNMFDGVVVNTLNVNFEKGYIAVNTKTLFENSETEAKYKELQSKVTSVIDKSALPFIPEESIMAATVNLNGSELFNKLNNWGIAKTIKDSMSPTRFDVIQNVLEDTKGEITFVLDGFKENTVENDADYYLPPFIPSFTAYSQQVEGTNILKTIKEIFGDEGVTEISKNSYKITKEGISVYVGLNGNQFYVTNDETSLKRITTNNNAYNNYYANLKTNSTGVFQGEFKGLEDLVKDIPFGGGPSQILTEAYIKYFLKIFAGYYFEQDSNFAGEGRLTLNDQQVNSLNVIMREVEKGVDNLSR